MTEFELTIIIIEIIKLTIQVVSITICSFTFVLTLIKYINKKK